MHTDNNFTHTEKEKLKELNNYDDSSLNEKIVENSNIILENKKDIQNLKENSEKNTSNINEFNKNLHNYSLVTETGYKLDLSIDNSTYIMTLKLLDKNEKILSTGEIDLPIESMIINVSYDSNVKRLTFTLQNGNIINVPLNDLISGLVTDESLENTLKNYSLIKDVPTKLSQLENDSNYVKNTDWATGSKGGVITTNSQYGTEVSTNNFAGNLRGIRLSNPDYYFGNFEGLGFISKYILEMLTNNTIFLKGTTEPNKDTKGYRIGQFYINTTNNKTYRLINIDNTNKKYTWEELTNKEYVDEQIGNIDTLLTDLNSGGGVE